MAEAASIARDAGWGRSLRTSGRLWDASSPLARECEAHGVSAVLADTLEEAMLGGPEPREGDVALSLGAPWTFTTEWIGRWGGLAFNLHPRRLPEHRGAGGSSWMILMRERLGMAAVHELTPEIDAGRIVARRTFVYPDSLVLPEEYDRKCEDECRLLLGEWLRDLLAGNHGTTRETQPDYLSIYWPRLSTQIHGWIDWSWGADDIVSFIRAFDRPYAGAKTFLRGAVVSLAGALRGTFRAHHPFQEGLIFRADQDGVHVAVRDGSLTLTELRLSDPDRPARPGDRFMTPRWLLEKALAARVSYSPDGTLRTEQAAPLGDVDPSPM